MTPPNHLDAAILITLSPWGVHCIPLRKGNRHGHGAGENLRCGSECKCASDQPEGPWICRNRQRRAHRWNHHRRRSHGKRATRSHSGARPFARRRRSRSPLANPTLSLRDTNGNVLANNDNWQDSQQADLAATGMAPPNRKESAILALLAPEITPQS